MNEIEIGDFYIDCKNAINSCMYIEGDHIRGIALYPRNDFSQYSDCSISSCRIEKLVPEEISFAIWLNGTLYRKFKIEHYFSLNDLKNILKEEEILDIMDEFKIYVNYALRALNNDPYILNNVIGREYNNLLLSLRERILKTEI